MELELAELRACQTDGACESKPSGQAQTRATAGKSASNRDPPRARDDELQLRLPDETYRRKRCREARLRPGVFTVEGHIRGECACAACGRSDAGGRIVRHDKHRSGPFDGPSCRIDVVLGSRAPAALSGAGRDWRAIGGPASAIDSPGWRLTDRPAAPKPELPDTAAPVPWGRLSRYWTMARHCASMPRPGPDGTAE